ncbi:OLC1v1031642C1 [Oldenlandia corymbosa var. corymbosa]|uniref:OLC1v1031642C1 n=1 Tax=Oldenlandia corymbosa var. corymbosa TaxID=529605 RepID=A0AAV1CKS1_OLDCO|nr:OLC1v1031642C1 [Oldenlandia corymbosa var. corymbosa]
MDLLAEELWMEILEKLPTKSLMICTCVCKGWHNLILDHNHITDDNWAVDTCTHRCEHQDYLLSKKKKGDSDDSSTTILATVLLSGLELPGCLLPSRSSCNGILCFTDWYGRPFCVYLCNPITRDYFRLPTPTVYPEDEKIYCTEAFGFGIGNSIHDYKVVRIVKHVEGHPNRFAAEIYKLTTNCWSERYRIIIFDFQGEKFERMEIPAQCWDRRGRRVNLTVLHDSIALLTDRSDYDEMVINSEFEVWMMREYGNSESWTKTCTVVLPPPPHATVPSRCILWQMPTCWNKELLAVSKYGDMFSYSLPQDEQQPPQPQQPLGVVKNIDPYLARIPPSFVIFQPTLVALSGRSTGFNGWGVCERSGAACYDPRFIGKGGVVFYFHGKSNEHFSLVSDTNLQINARFIGHRPAGRTRDYTWIQALGILFNSHSVSLEATKLSKWDDEIDHLKFTYDGQEVFVAEGTLAEWISQYGDVKIKRFANKNGVILSIPQLVEVTARVVPVTEEENRVHNYQLPSDDCFAHLEVSFNFLGVSSNVDGVIGRTYRPDFENPAKLGVAMPTFGGEDKYRTTSLFSADCKDCLYDPNSKVDDRIENPMLLMNKHDRLDCSSGSSRGNGIVCKK